MNEEGILWLRDRMKEWKNLIDLLFEGITCTLKREVDVIYRVDSLIDPRDNEQLNGFLFPVGNKNIIFIAAHPENKSIEGRTLLHEILHINFEHRRKEDDPFIEKLTVSLWNEFSESQKRMVMDFIPEELSDERPMKAEVRLEEAFFVETEIVKPKNILESGECESKLELE